MPRERRRKMKKAISAVCFADLLFLLLLSLGAYVPKELSLPATVAAYIIPSAAALIIWKLSAEKIAMPRFIPKAKDLALSLPYLAPFIGIVFIISFLTSLLLGLFGHSNTTDLSGNIWLMILKHAAIPAILEELLFRLVPIALIAPYSKKNALFFSAIAFALLHCNFFQIPYAFFAGLVFAALDIAAGSIYPSLILHFINNLIAIFFARNGADPIFSAVLFSSLALCSAISLVLIFIKRNACKKSFSEIFCDECKLSFTFPAVILSICAIFLAALNLL